MKGIKKKIILYVEDEPDHAFMVKMLLESQGFTPIIAVDGEEGLKIANEQRPDLVLLDLAIPKISGFRVLNKMKANPKTKDIPVIVITAYGEKAVEEKCLKYGATEYITKPYDTNKLTTLIKRLVNHK